MANIAHISESDSAWALKDLTSYGISIETQKPSTFFKQFCHPINNLRDIDPMLFDKCMTPRTPGLSDTTHRVLMYLELAAGIHK